MKLYATVTSERATKGQGGNDFLNIVITNEHEEEIMRVHANGRGKEKPRIAISFDGDKLCFPPQPIDIKGKRQKGEIDASKHNCIYDHDHVNESENCA
ncbi:MAG TPA: hypothetical protein VMV72_04870 [Verrucomicrobiae bacterium]|nr:hypothetical protein [Verrucomicrobiae bacterium]